ncbi:MAG TPA: MBL fold metallo-hydrolase [Phycisphaerales bacterium]|nr:MBL fold metallo-hydrolase [Phycisphaerales bacterium]
MTRTFTITTLVENTATGRNIRAEHGLSYWIEADGHCILFDTAQTPDVLMHNARRLKFDFADVEAVVLSHGHYDHTGGLMAVLDEAKHPRLYLHPDALAKRYSQHTGGVMVDVGVAGGLSRAMLADKAEIVWTQSPTEIVPGLWVTGQVPRINQFEDTGGDFYLDAKAQQVDPIVDDQSIFFDTGQGVVVLLGCAHAGVINTLTHIRLLTNDRPIYAVIGGMHLLHASEERMTQTIESFRALNVQLLAPTHCTGPFAAARLWSEFPDRWQPCRVGARFVFELPETI